MGCLEMHTCVVKIEKHAWEGFKRASGQWLSLGSLGCVEMNTISLLFHVFKTCET